MRGRGPGVPDRGNRPFLCALRQPRPPRPPVVAPQACSTPIPFTAADLQCAVSGVPDPTGNPGVTNGQCSYAADGDAHTHYRPACHPCWAESITLTVSLPTEYTVQCAKAVNMGSGTGGGLNWHGGLKLEKSVNRGESWLPVGRTWETSDPAADMNRVVAESVLWSAGHGAEGVSEFTSHDRRVGRGRTSLASTSAGVIIEPGPTERCVGCGCFLLRSGVWQGRVLLSGRRHRADSERNSVALMATPPSPPQSGVTWHDTHGKDPPPLHPPCRPSPGAW